MLWRTFTCRKSRARETQPCVQGPFYILCAFPSTVSSPRMHKHLRVRVFISYLNSKLIAGVASVHLSAGQVKLPFIKGSPVVDVV